MWCGFHTVPRMQFAEAEFGFGTLHGLTYSLVTELHVQLSPDASDVIVRKHTSRLPAQK